MVAVLRLDVQGEKNIDSFPLFSVLTWMTGSRLNNRRQKEKRSLNRSGNVKYVKWYSFFFVVRSAQGLRPTRQEQTGSLQNGRFLTVKSYWGFLGQLHIRHQRNGSELLSPPTVFLFLYIYGNNVWATVWFFSVPTYYSLWNLVRLAML